MLPAEVAEHIAARLERELGFRAARTGRMHGGNNMLLTFTAGDGRRLLAKVYQPDDARHGDRLGREFRALRFLRRAGFDDVPRPYLRSDEHRYGVYSFEEGHRRASVELTGADAERFAGFLLRLDELGPPVPGPDLPPRDGGGVGAGARLAGFRATLEQFRARAGAPDALPVLRRAATGAALGEAEAALRALERAAAADPLLAAGPPRDALRLNPGDFGVHNALFRDDGTPCFLDFEYASWADPCWVAAGFVHHDANAGLAPAARDRFLDAYRRGARPATAERLPTLLRLTEFGWVVEHLAGTRPERLRIGAETTPGFDPDAYVANHVRRFEQRLAAYLARPGAGA
jgi:hypothetical protein